MNAAILTDTTHCIGCNECALACKRVNRLEADLPRRWDLERRPLRHATGPRSSAGPRRTFVRKQCRHCLEPACASACPVGALSRTASGAGGLRRRQVHGLPLLHDGVPVRHPALRLGSARALRPQVHPLLRARRDAARPAGAARRRARRKATIFGDRDALLAEAHRRIREQPGQYIDHVWGEHEVGGTSVLYISNRGPLVPGPRRWRSTRRCRSRSRDVAGDGRRSPSSFIGRRRGDGRRELDHRPAHETGQAEDQPMSTGAQAEGRALADRRPAPPRWALTRLPHRPRRDDQPLRRHALGAVDRLRRHGRRGAGGRRLRHHRHGLRLPAWSATTPWCARPC